MDIQPASIDCHCKTQAGFTLIEVLIAIGLLAVGILAIANMQITGIQGNASARRITERVTFAQDKLETLLSLPYTHTDLDPDGNTHSEASPPAGYTVQWTVTEDTPVPGTKLIAVTVTGQGTSTQLTGVKPAL